MITKILKLYMFQQSINNDLLKLKGIIHIVINEYKKLKLFKESWNLKNFLKRYWSVCILSHFSHIRLFATLWTVACQAPLSMGFSRQEYWSGLLWPPPGYIPDPGIEPISLVSPALQAGFYPLIHLGNPTYVHICQQIWTESVRRKNDSFQKRKWLIFFLVFHS